MIPTPPRSADSKRMLVRLVLNTTLLCRLFAGALCAALLLAPVCDRARAQDSAGQASSAGRASADPQSQQGPVIATGAATVVTVHGKIVAVDQAKKLVTLQTPGGKPVSLHVYNPYNLAAAKPGVPFVAKFYEIATLHKLGPGQSPPKPSLIEGIVSAEPGQTPGATLGSQTQFAVTVNAIDKNDKAISLKGPDGKVEVVDVANPEMLDQVRVGENIVVTLTDAVVVGLDKEGAAPAGGRLGIDPGVRLALERACTALSSAKTLTYHAEISFDSVLPSHVKLQYAAAMDVAIARPNHLAISYQSDLGAKAIWYDGRTLTVLDPAHRAYVNVPAPDTIDGMLVEASEHKNLSIPLEGFDFSQPCRRVYPLIQRAKYVGVNDVGGIACDHLAFIQQDVDWQLWIDHGKNPLPRKIVITYKKLPAEPQWAAVLSNWRFNRPLPTSLFQPKIPKGAIKTTFIGQEAHK
jgi:hypothetical protein